MSLIEWIRKLIGPKRAQENVQENHGGRIIVAEVLEWSKHPNADRLRVVTLDIGSEKVGPVVCGANNFDAGDKVVLALPGATIPHNLHDPENQPFVLDKATIRGVESQGMLCAAFELGIGPLSDKPEILILKADARPGIHFTPDLVK